MPMLNILFILSSSHSPSDKNFNHFQRAHYLSRHARLTILARKGAIFEASTAQGTRILRSPWPGKAGQLLYGIFLLGTGRARGFDIVLTEPTVLAVLGFAAKSLGAAKKWVVDVWDIPIRCKRPDLKVYQWRCAMVRTMLKVLFRFADYFVVSILPQFEFKGFNIPEGKVLTLPNAIWLDKAEIIASVDRPEKSQNLICMRSIHYADMGLDTLAQAFMLIKREFPEATLEIIGRIPDEVLPQVACIRHDPAVRFHEFVEHEQLKGMVRTSAAAVIPFKDVPDLAQTYPIKVVEYFSLGVPVVASNIAGLGRMIRDRETGLLFQSGDSKDLAAKVKEIFLNQELAGRIADKARGDIGRFDCVEKNRIILERLECLTSSGQRS